MGKLFSIIGYLVLGMSNKKEYIIATILTLMMTFIEMSALPMVLFCKIEIADIQPIYIALILNLFNRFWYLLYIQKGNLERLGIRINK